MHHCVSEPNITISVPMIPGDSKSMLAGKLRTNVNLIGTMMGPLQYIYKYQTCGTAHPGLWLEVPVHIDSNSKSASL